MNYQAKVTEARSLLRRTEADLWRFAELTGQVLAGGITQRQWGADVGASQPYVSLVARVWARFGHLPATERPRFADGLETVRSRSETVVNASEERARRYRGQILSRPLAERVELAKRLLDDPDVARKVGTLKEPASRPTRPRLASGPAGSFDVAADRLTQARKALTLALHAVRDAELSDEDRAGLLALLAEAEAAGAWIRSFLESGDRSWDEALERLLRAG